MKAEEIEQDLKALRSRREEIAGEREEAQEAVAEARSALVDGRERSRCYRGLSR